MRNYFLLILLLSTLLSNAQNSPRKFGDVTLNDLTMVSYNKDTSASAVILFNVGEARLFENMVAYYDRHVRIKFFGIEEINNWATHTIYLDHLDESFSKLKAVTYNLEGGVIKVDKLSDDAFFKTKVDRYTDKIQFTLPNVKKGSIIEYSYSIRTGASLVPGWQFQYTIPTILTDYEISIPRSFTFNHDVQGMLAIDEHRSNSYGSNDRWTLLDVPAFKKEPFMPNYEDYISKINFTITEIFIPGRPIIKFNSSWLQIIKDLEKDTDFGIQINGSGFLEKIVGEIIANKKDENEKIIAIVSYVKNNVAWNKIMDKVPDRPFKKVLESKAGSTSEINLLLVSMLMKANINAYPLLISTRDHGKVRPTYLFREFNDVICIVKTGEKSLLLDATDKELSYLALPERCLNDQGLVVSKENAEWVDIVSMKSRIVSKAELSVTRKSAIKGKLSVYAEGLEASKSRKLFNELGKDKYISNTYSGHRWEVVDSDIEITTDATKSHREVVNIEGDESDYFDQSDSLVFFNPYIIDQIDENPFKSEDRHYPIDFVSPFEDTFTLKLTILDGYVVETLPESKVMLLPDNGGKYIYSVSRNGNLITIISQLLINRQTFDSDNYAALKEFFALIVSKQNEQIVLKKR